MNLGDPQLEHGVKRALARVLAWGPGHSPRGGLLAGADLDAVIAAACGCRVAALFERAAVRAGLALSPEQHRRLHAAGTRVAAARARALQALKVAAGALVEAGVPVLVLKGGALCLTLYERADQRLLTDVDLLIRPGDAGRADAALRARGCRRSPALVREDFYPRFHYECGYDTPGPGATRLDVHVRPLRPLRFACTLDEDALWAAPRSLSLDGLELQCPGNEDMLIHLAAHSAIHGHARLVWLLDQLLFVRRYGADLDVGVLCERARRWRLALAVREGLRAAARRFDDARLCALAKRVGGPRVAGWRDELVLRQAPRDEGRPFTHLAVNLLTTPGLGFRLGYLARVLFPGRSHMAQVYPWQHPGWLLCAHAYRAARAVLRALAPAARAVRPRTVSRLETAPGSG